MLREMAYEMLEGFGDVAHEWTENRLAAFHLRRRLTVDEEKKVGEAVDCRNTAEGLQRFEAIKDMLHPQAILLAQLELREAALS